MSEIYTIKKDTCLVCNSSGLPLYKGLRDVLFGVEGLWNVDICKKCDIAWLNPSPTDKTAHLLYEKYYTHQQLNNEFLKQDAFITFPKNKKIKYSVLHSWFNYPIPGISKSYKIFGIILGFIPGIQKKIKISIGAIPPHRNGKLLDLGCGNGDYLLEMKYLGFETYGIEIDNAAAEIARSNGLQVTTGALTKTSYEENFFNAIHTNNVIEHLSNPDEIITMCHTILKKGGLLVLKTCNINSLAYLYYKQHYRGLEIPRHINIFSPKALEKLGEKSGFKVVYSGTSFNQYIWASSKKIKEGIQNPADATSNTYITLLKYVFVSTIIFFAPHKGDDILIVLEKK